MYLFIVIDSFSKFAEVFLVKEITTSYIIAKLRKFFCDNGRHFTSDEFRQFLAINILALPGHSARNEKAESFVKVLKKSIISNLKSDKNCPIHTNLNRFLTHYRNSKHCTTGETPAKLFFGRSLKSEFDNLKPPMTGSRIRES